MKKLLLATAISSTIVFSAMANAADYKLDTDDAHAAINFKVSHLGYSFITGRFDKFDGQFSYDAKNIEHPINRPPSHTRLSDDAQ